MPLENDDVCEVAPGGAGLSRDRIRVFRQVYSRYFVALYIVA
jgi:hypothetical protein